MALHRSPRKLKAKFMLMSFAIIALVIAFASFIFLLTRNTSDVIHRVVHDDVIELERNADISRSLNETFLHTHFWVSTFTSDDSALKEADRYTVDPLKRYLTDPNIQANEFLHQYLSRFNQSQKKLLQEAHVIVAHLYDIDTTMEAYQKKLDHLESTATEHLLTLSVNGHSYEANAIEQMLISIPDMRGKMLLKQVSLKNKVNTRLRPGFQPQKKDPGLGYNLQDIHELSNTISTAGVSYSSFKKDIDQMLQHLTTQFDTLNTLLNTFQKELIRLDTAQDKINIHLHKIDQERNHAIQRIQEEIKTKTKITERLAVLLSLCIFFAILGMVMFFRSKVILPISNLSDEVDDMCERLDLDRKGNHNSRDNELQLLSKHFQEMSQGVEDSMLKLKRSEEHFRSIFTNLPVPYFALDSEGMILDVNQAIIDVLGTQREQLVGNHCRILLQNHRHQNIEQTIGELIEMGTMKEDWSIQRADGTYINMLLCASTRYDIEGKFRQANAVLIDITERKRIETLQAQFAAFFDHLPDLACVMDPEGTLRLVNEQMMDHLKLKREILIGKHYTEIMSRDTIKAIQRHWAKVIHEKEEVLFEESSPLADFQISLFPILDKENQIESVTLISRDITTQKANYRELKASKERTEAALNTKEKFLANMSHELRTPMNSILGNCYILEDTKLESAQKESLQQIEASSHTLLELIDNLLELSSIDSQGIILNNEPLDLPQIFQDLEDRFSASIKAKGLHFETFIAANVSKNLMGDSLRLKQIITHLLSNAVKFTLKGEITLSVELIEKKASSSELLFSIKDTGIGMSDSQRENIYDSFSQIDSSPTRKFGGTGVGLALLKRLLQAFESEIQLESQLGKGSTFSFNLELEEAESPHNS